jgi:hypothetical protein
MNKNVERALMASINQYAEVGKLNAQNIGENLVAVFKQDLDFLAKVEAFDAVFDDNADFEDLREVHFDLLMINFFTSDVNKLEADYLDSKEWEAIEEDTLDRGTELLNLLLYINECHDEEIKPELEDFLKEFLLVEEDEFQDEFHIYEDIIENQQLAETTVEEISANAKILKLGEEMEELFVPFMTFFLEPVQNEQTINDLVKFGPNKAFDASVYSLISNFNKN